MHINDKIQTTFSMFAIIIGTLWRRVIRKVCKVSEEYTKAYFDGLIDFGVRGARENAMRAARIYGKIVINL